MEQRSTALRRGYERLDGLDSADLVVHPHDRADGHVGTRQLVERPGHHDAVRVDSTKTLLGALPGCLVHGSQHRLMLDGCRHDRVAPLPPPGSPAAKNGDVVSFGAA